MKQEHRPKETLVTETQNTEKATFYQSPQKPVTPDFEKTYMTKDPSIDTTQMIERSELINNIGDSGNS